MSVYPNTGCHAVLALLSEGYPPLEGRSPTRYSPVCHSTDPFRDFRVGLACVRHAAIVDSEPGSNSQVKFVAFSPKPEEQLVQPDRLLIWLSDSNSAVALAFARAMADRSSCVPPSHALRRASARQLILDGLCLHVLSSFQRTGSVAPSGHSGRFDSRDHRRAEPNLSNLTNLTPSVNPAFKSPPPVLRLRISRRTRQTPPTRRTCPATPDPHWTMLVRGFDVRAPD